MSLRSPLKAHGFQWVLVATLPMKNKFFIDFLWAPFARASRLALLDTRGALRYKNPRACRGFLWNFYCIKKQWCVILSERSESKDLVHYVRTPCREGLYVPPRFEVNKIHDDKLINVNLCSNSVDISMMKYEIKPFLTIGKHKFVVSSWAKRRKPRSRRISSTIR